MSQTIIGIISILSGFIAIWINEILIHRRDTKHKKEELMLSHLKEMLEWLNTMQQSVFTISRILIESIGIYKDMDRKEQLQKTFSIETNELVEKSIIFCDSYAELNNSFGIDLDLSQLNKTIAQFTIELRNLREKYYFPDENNSELDEINKKKRIVLEQIRKRINIVSNEISKLLSK